MTDLFDPEMDWGDIRADEIDLVKEASALIVRNHQRKTDDKWYLSGITAYNVAFPHVVMSVTLCTGERCIMLKNVSVNLATRTVALR